MRSENHTLNNPLDLRDEEIENVSQLANGAAAWSGGTCYGYHEGCLVLVAHIRLGRCDGEPREFCATFYRGEMKSDFRLHKDELVVWRHKTELPLLGIGENYIEQPVLVGIVEVGQETQERGELAVRSIIRLRSSNSCPCFIAQRCDSPHLFREGVGRIGNRELEPVLHRGRIRSTFTHSDGINQIVESRAEVVNTIPGEQSQSVEGRRRLKIDNAPGSKRER